MKIDWPERARLQQGMIFSNCRVPGYEGVPGWGVAITARCDLANAKVPLLNYLPVVKFEDWIERDGRALIAARSKAEEDSALEQLLRDLGTSVDVLLGTSLEEVFSASLAPLERKRKTQFEQRCSKALHKHKMLVGTDHPSVQWLGENFPKIYAGVVKELMTHRLAGYYFLPRVEPDEPVSCYVILLRSIGAMPSEIASRIPSGLSAQQVASISGAGEHFSYSNRDEVAMPIGVISSPFIEHLMQMFSALLSRIGLPNTEASHIEKYATPRQK